MNEVVAFDSKEFEKRIRAGEGALITQELAEDFGVTFDEQLGEQFWLKPGVNTRNYKLAMDAQPELLSIPNSGIPSYLANVLYPTVIMYVVSPMKAAQIVGESQKGSWETETVQFMVAEQTGLTSAYGDFNDNGMSGVNVNFPVRQNFLFQAYLKYGELELARAALAKIDWASQQQISNALTLAKQMNDIFFYGVANLQNYGLINSPDLPAPITPTYSWLTNASANAFTVYQDIVRLYIQLIGQANGTVDMESPMVLAMSPQNAVALEYITQTGMNLSVKVLLKQNFPNLRIETAPQYATPSGQLVQLFVESLDGQRTAECVYTSKLRAHQLLAGHSSWSQKRSSGAVGTIWYRAFLCAQLLG